MAVLNFIRRTIFWLTIAFIISSIFALTIGQFLPIEFRGTKIQSEYYYLVFTILPFAFLLTLIGTLKKKHSKLKNWIIGIVTVLSAGLCFFILVRIMFSVAFGVWTNETILYRNKDNKNITITRQIFDVGALGYQGHRIAELTPVLKYFQTVKEVDTAQIDKSQWIFVNEENLRFL